MTSWATIAAEVIASVDATLAASSTIKERRRALRAAYPFGERNRWPYRVWLKVQRTYLGRHGYVRGGPTPIELAIAAATAAPSEGSEA